jgi:F-type H+-transporting ATPase subunit b
MRFWPLIGVVLIALVLPSGPVAAAEAKEGDGKLDLFKGALDLSIYTIVVFLILFFLLRKYAWPQIVEGLDRRERTIAHDKQEADRARKEAADLRTQLQSEKARADDQIRQMMDKARQDAEKLEAEIHARGKAEVQTERQRMLREIQIEKDDALHQIWTRLAQLATEISNKAIRKNLSEQDHRVLIDEALAEFRASAAGRRQQIEEARA